MIADAITFTGERLDRAADRRTDPAWIAAQVASPNARAVLAADDGMHVTVQAGDDGADAGAEPRLALLPLAALRASEPLLLGLDASQIADGGIVRRCPACGTDHHPRTDPVVIMLVTGGDRVLLGRQPTLAGFVEPGESLEEAVVREVREEAGVEVAPPQYVASQPWPFPTSLMLGFTAPYLSGEPRRVDKELEDVRWFDRADLVAALEARHDAPLGVPPRFAIARRLIEQWVRR